MRTAIFSKKVVSIIAVIFLLCSVAGVGYFFISEKNDEINELKTQNTQLTEQVNQLNGELTQKSDDQTALQAQIDSQNATIEQQKATIDEQLAKIKDLQKQLDKAQKQIKKNSYIQAAGTAVAGDKVCYLTFDDGPSASTPKLLKTLRECGVKATFFVVNTAYLDDYIDDIYADGHAVGLHCNSHTWSQVYASEQAYYADLQTIDDLIYKYIGLRTKVIRFPGGSNNTVSKKYCKGIMTNVSLGVLERGYMYFDWNVNSGDASGIKYSANQIANNVINSAKNKKQACVLMHDAKSKKTTVEALPKIVASLSAMGYSFKTLDVSSPIFHHNVQN